METLQSKFENYVSGHSICSHDDKILLAVSGGVDSMVMLSLFAEAGYQIGVAHCNFQLRGPEAEEDELLVAEAAEKLGVPHYNIRFDTLKEMESTGESVQMAAVCVMLGLMPFVTNMVISVLLSLTMEMIRSRPF